MNQREAKSCTLHVLARLGQEEITLHGHHPLPPGHLLAHFVVFYPYPRLAKLLLLTLLGKEMGAQRAVWSAFPSLVHSDPGLEFSAKDLVGPCSGEACIHL